MAILQVDIQIRNKCLYKHGTFFIYIFFLYLFSPKFRGAIAINFKVNSFCKYITCDVQTYSDAYTVHTLQTHMKCHYTQHKLRWVGFIFVRIRVRTYTTYIPC